MRRELADACQLWTALGERSEYAAAVTEFDQALAIWPDDPETLVKRGSACGSGQVRRGHRQLPCSTRVEVRRRHGLSQPGGRMAARGQYDEAIAMYRKALIIQPGRAGIDQPGNGPAAAGQAVRAETAFQEALSVEPWNVEAHTSLGAVRHAGERQGRDHRVPGSASREPGPRAGPAQPRNCPGPVGPPGRGDHLARESHSPRPQQCRCSPCPWSDPGQPRPGRRRRRRIQGGPPPQPQPRPGCACTPQCAASAPSRNTRTGYR